MVRRATVVAAALLPALHPYCAGGEDCPTDLLAVQLENAALRAELEKLRAAGRGAVLQKPDLATNVTATVALLKSKRLKIEATELVVVVLFMGFLCMLPRLWPFKRCCETRLYKVYPLIVLIDVAVFCYAMMTLHEISVNQVFFLLVEVAEVVINETNQLLVGVAGLFILAVMWKFKDRVLESLGIDNPLYYIGEFRDWATCWSMSRFQPIELLLWKVEGIPSAKMHASNDMFCEVSHGYNINVRTRVHEKAGHTCFFKETMQLNFDPYDGEARLTITVKNQDVLGATTVAKVQLGSTQVARLEEPSLRSRTIGWASAYDQSDGGLWAASRFKPIDLIPAGRIYIRIVPVGDDYPSSGWCCFPGNGRGAAMIEHDERA